MRPATRPRLTLASDSNLRGAIHTSRDLDRQLANLAHTAFATTLAARNGDHGALAATLVAGRHCHHIEDRRALADLAQTTALRAAHRVGSRLGTAAATGRAAFQAAEFDLLFHAKDRFLEADRQRIAQIGAALRAALALALAGRAAEEGLEDTAEWVGSRAEWVEAGRAAQAASRLSANFSS